MSPDRFHRINARFTEIICLAVAAIVALIWLATVADYLLRLGWGWDIENIWTAPIVVAGALLVRTLARAVFRWIGAID